MDVPLYLLIPSRCNLYAKVSLCKILKWELMEQLHLIDSISLTDVFWFLDFGQHGQRLVLSPLSKQALELNPIAPNDILGSAPALHAGRSVSSGGKIQPLQTTRLLLTNSQVHKFIRSIH